jgi:hypothetical protein
LCNADGTAQGEAGKVVGHLRKFGSRMIRFILSRRRRDVYGDRLQVEQRSVNVNVDASAKESVRDRVRARLPALIALTQAALAKPGPSNAIKAIEQPRGG